MPKCCIIPSVFLCGLVVCLMAPWASATIVVDDYEVGPYTLNAVVSGQTYYHTQSGLPTSRVAGGVRHLEINSSAPPGSLQVTSGDIRLNSTKYSANYYYVTYNGNPAGSGAGPMLNLNLSGMSQFEVICNYLDRNIGIRINVRSGTVIGTWYDITAGTGVLAAPLTSFSNYGSINWADIDKIQLEIMTGYIPGVDAHMESISNFCIVPEPASISLLLVGGLALLRRRR